MKRKLIAIFVTLAMAVSFLPTFSVSAETTYKGYKVDDTGLYYDFSGTEYSIVDCDENAKNVVIPSSVNGYAIKVIKCNR